MDQLGPNALGEVLEPGRAIVAAAVGFLALIPFWLAASHAGEANPAFTVLILALGNVGVLVLLRVPSLERWVHGHVLAGR